MFFPLAVLFHQFEDLHRGVVVVKHLALRRLADQLIVRREENTRSLLHKLPLGRSRKRNTEAPLELLEAVERQAASVTEKRHHADRGGVVLLLSHPLGGLRRENLSAEAAAEPLLFDNLRLERRSALYPHESRWLLESRKPPFTVRRRTPIARLQRLVGDLCSLRAAVGIGAVSSVALRLRLLGLGLF